MKAGQASDESDKDEETDDVADADLNKDELLMHKLRFKEQGATLAKDASTKGDNWHDLYDPRNTLNRRKRGDDGRKERDTHDSRDSQRHRNRH